MSLFLLKEKAAKAAPTYSPVNAALEFKKGSAVSDQTEMSFCKPCGVETPHILVLVRKPSAFANSKNRKRKEFIAGLIKGWFLGPFIASMDDLSRHLICEKCGTTTIEE
ncbi:MAG: hypothetical protein ACJAS1_005114 [Oleiphilaceae bacterium]